jgi:hypothetical protein
MFSFVKKYLFKRKDISEMDNEIKVIKDYHRQYDPLNGESIAEDDFLGLAASAGHRAKIAIKDKNYELAWKLYSEQTQHYYKSCEKFGQSPHSLAGRVSFDMANVLRLEGNHILALVHLLYAMSTNPNVAYMMKKLPAYFNRSKLNIDFEEITYFLYKQQKAPDFRSIQNKVYEWDKIRE